MDDLIAAQATVGYDLSTGHCDMASASAVTLSACYARCASDDDCAAFSFENGNGNGNSGTPGNTDCYYKTMTAPVNTCSGTPGMSDGKLVPVASPGLSYLQVKPNSVL